MSSCSAGEARVVGEAWAELALLLLTTNSSEEAVAAGEGPVLTRLTALLAVLCSSLEADAVLGQTRSWLVSGQPASCFVLVGGGETTVTGTRCFQGGSLFSYCTFFFSLKYQLALDPNSTWHWAYLKK